TDSPQSIIMPEVVIPEGAKSVSVPMEGGIPGTGTLFVEAPGFNAIKVPVSVLGSTAVEVDTVEAVDVIEPVGETVIVEEEDVLIVE
ncbi:MAG: hypothetical protein AAGA45_06610, partial [Verrucomicrobiota bacterium]